MSYVLVHILKFRDLIEPNFSATIFHEGTKEECEKLMEEIPAVSYSGNRLIESSNLVIVDKEDVG